MRRSASDVHPRRARRGAVLPLVCVLLLVLVGAAALAIDLGRQYQAAEQLRTAADAAALAAARGWQRDPSRASVTPTEYATQVVRGNRVVGAVPELRPGEILPIRYDPATRAVTAAGAWNQTQGVQVTVRTRVPYILAGALGLTPRTITRTGVAWVANINGATCVRPFTIPYTRVYEHLAGLYDRPWSSRGHQAPDLDQAAVTLMSSLYGVPPVRRTVVMVPPWADSDRLNRNNLYNVGEWHTNNFTGGTVADNRVAFETFFGEPVGSANCQVASARVDEMLTPYRWPSSSISIMIEAAERGLGTRICHQAGHPGDATCRDARATVGVRTRVALADSIPIGSAFGNRVRVVAHARVMCFFRPSASGSQTSNDVCPSTRIKDEYGVEAPWHMPPHPGSGVVADRGYPAGTIVVLLEGPTSLDLTRDVILDNRTSLTQRLLLVR